MPWPPSDMGLAPKEKRRAGKASEVHSEKGEEPAKRKYKSKHGSKKAAKKAHRSRRSHDPEADEWELDIGEDVPKEKLRETLSAMHRVTRGLRASSEKAESAGVRYAPCDGQMDTC